MTSPYSIAQKNILVALPILFVLIYPLAGFLVAIYILWNKREYLSDKERNILIAILALFFALVAFTQVSPEGDITRTYNGIISRANADWKSFIALSLLEDKYVITSITNNFLYTLTGRVETVSLFWIFIIYYLSCKAIENIVTYLNIERYQKSLFIGVFSLLVCFMIFVQVTELMKQAVAAALFFYSYSVFLIGKKKKAFIIFVISLFIHATSWFYFPLFFVHKLKLKVVFILTILSFACRQFDLMTFVASLFTRLNILSTIMNIADGYSSFDKDFTSSSANYFFTTFAVFFIFVMIAYYLNRNTESKLLKVILIYVAILNLNYSSDHNFTRMLLVLFPFYVFTFFLIKNKAKQLAMSFLVCTALINYYFTYGRLYGTGYTTSYLDGSIMNVFTYLIVDYFKISTF